MNILCLHGCCQNVEILKNLMRDYITISAKGDLKGDLKGVDLKGDHPKWFFMEGKYDHSRCGKTWFHPELSLDQIGQDVVEMDEINRVMNEMDIFIKENNINVLFGFSQGGNVVDCYLRLKSDVESIKCAVIYAGYTFPKLVLLKSPVKIPILYIYSENDEIVLPEKRPKDYENMTTLTHEKGHKIPTQKIVIKQVLDFVNKFAKKNF